MRGAGLQLAEAAGKTWQDLRQSCPQSTEAKCALGFRTFMEDYAQKSRHANDSIQQVCCKELFITFCEVRCELGCLSALVPVSEMLPGFPQLAVGSHHQAAPECGDEKRRRGALV